MKKILFITAFPPNKMTAGQNFSRQLLNRMVGQGWSVDLYYITYPGHKPELADDVRMVGSYSFSKTDKFFNALFRIWDFPLFTVRYDRRVARHLGDIAPQYNCIYFDFSQVFLYARNIEHPNKVAMSHDVIIQKFTRGHSVVSKLLFYWIKRTECKALRGFNHIFCFSNKDRKLISRHYGTDAIAEPFFIDPMASETDYSQIEVERCFVMFGAWNRKENTDGLRWLIESVLPKTANIHIKIIGQGLDTAMIEGCSNVEYLGFVDNPYRIIASSQGLLAPIFSGAGVKVKVIEALATGTPIVGTEIAFEGIESSLGQMFLCSTAQEWVDTLDRWVPIDKKQKSEWQSAFEKTYGTNHIMAYL